MKNNYIISIGIWAALSFCSCGKEFLDYKRDSNQVIPSKISDYQALLDNSFVMNSTASFELSIIGSDEYVLSDKAWEAISPEYYSHVKNGYIWADNVYEGKDVADWNWGYQRILYANMALDVEKIKPNDHDLAEWNNVRGQALFHRAFTFYQLAQTFCGAYDAPTVETSEGLPLRTNYDVSVGYGRGTLKEVYELILKDLNKSIDLLPDMQVNNYRPSKTAVYALLARVYRDMELWDEAFQCSEKVLSVRNGLLDYNDFRNNTAYTFEGLNKGLNNREIIFYCHTGSGYIITNGMLHDRWLKDVFTEKNDLRKELYFKEDNRYFGSYASINYFTGLAVDEILLIRAECNVRKGDFSNALNDLNHLRRHRFLKGSYEDIKDAVKEALLVLIDLERKRELYMRGIRWSDLRHQNLREGEGITLERHLNGRIYLLEPHDPAWVWPLPEVEKQSDIR